MRISLSELNLGAEAVNSLEIDGRPMFIETDARGNPTRILRNKCAHFGSPVRLTKSGFTCPTHGWTYDRRGKNTVPGSPNLPEVEFELEGSDLILHLNEMEPLLSGQSAQTLKGDETLELLAHAAFFLTAGESRVLFDPWLVGTAYWGAWHHYPANPVDVNALSPSHIVITHPHPDHFHPETMSHFDRQTPVLIPNFESGILQKKLTEMGFRRLVVQPWEEVFWFEPEIGFAFLRPTSFWEDSACLVQVRDWVWLNQNDSGAPLRDDLIPEHLDLLASAFDVGASGWPLTWDVPNARKQAVLQAARNQTLQTIAMRCAQTKAKSFAPFAGFWRHGLTDHEEFLRSLPHVDHTALSLALEASGTSLIPTLPSSVIRLKDMSHSSDPKVVERLTEPWSLELREEPEPGNTSIALEKSINDLMASLQLLGPAVDVEPVIFEVNVEAIGYCEQFRFGDLKLEPLSHIVASLPRWVADCLVSGDPVATWNHFDIGYWIRWSRNPDVYPPKFMRLLQLGYPSGLISRGAGLPDAVLDRSVGDFIERDAELASAILNRAGLPCVACKKSNSDSLRNALEIHSVAKDLEERVKHELTALMAD